MIVFIVAVIWLLIGPKIAIANLVFSPQARVAILVLNLAFFLYHVAAMVDAYSVAKTERYRGFSRTSSTAPIVLAGLVALTMVLHGVPEVIGMDVNNAANILGVGHPDVLPSFTPRPTNAPSLTPQASPTPDNTVGPSGSVEPTPVPSGSIGPSPTPRACPPSNYAGWAPADDGRLNILLSGSDSRSDEGAGTNSIRTDSMMLLSIDIATCKAALFSFPRNMNCDLRYPGRVPGAVQLRERLAGTDGSHPEFRQPEDRWRHRRQPEGLRRFGRGAAWPRCLDRRAVQAR
jgi:hypothetical protein